jgi:hypothetical protein
VFDWGFCLIQTFHSFRAMTASTTMRSWSAMPQTDIPDGFLPTAIRSLAGSLGAEEKTPESGHTLQSSEMKNHNVLF